MGTSCTLQEFIFNRLAELRVMTFARTPDTHQLQVMYMPLYDAEGMSMTGATNLTPEQALKDIHIWNGNERAQKHAEDEARRMTNLWLLWYKSEWNQPFCPPSARF